MNKTKMGIKIDRTGEVYVSTEGYTITIIEFFGHNNCTIILEDGQVYYNRRYESIKGGRLKNLLHKSVYGVGYFGVGKYKSWGSPESINCHSKWRAMLGRCYNEEKRHEKPTYMDTFVCEEWHNYQNFAKWYEENLKPHMKNWALDKDILQKGGKLYSPETCCLVPIQVNGVLSNRQMCRGELPVGVQDSKKGKRRYFGHATTKKGRIKTPCFYTVEEAFEAYKVLREQYIKDVADDWKGLIADNVYEALINYKVEITD